MQNVPQDKLNEPVMQNAIEEMSSSQPPAKPQQKSEPQKEIEHYYKSVMEKPIIKKQSMLERVKENQDLFGAAFLVGGAAGAMAGLAAGFLIGLIF